MTKTTVQSYTRRLMKGCKRQRPMSSLTVPNGTRLTWYAIALTLALTMPANAAERADSAADRADKILSGCKIMLGHLAENKEPPARGGGRDVLSWGCSRVRETLSADGSAFSRYGYDYPNATRRDRVH
jgi:hypothetical protein